MFAGLKSTYSGLVNSLQEVFRERTRMINVPSVTSYTGDLSDTKKVADFDLGKGRWVVFAKASATAYGGNLGRADLRLKVLGKEGDVTKSDESYESASPSLGASMTVILPFDVISTAHFEVNVGSQSGMAAFKHIVVTAIREA